VFWILDKICLNFSEFLQHLESSTVGMDARRPKFQKDQSD
jgi:hypothetical protein